MDNFKEKENVEQGIDLQSSGKETSKAGSTRRETSSNRRSSSNGSTSKKTNQEVKSNTTMDDMNGGTIGAQDYNTHNATGMYAGLWEAKSIQLDSSTVTNRASNIVNMNKNRRNKMTASGQPRDTVNMNPNLVMKHNYNPVVVSHGV